MLVCPQSWNATLIQLCGRSVVGQISYALRELTQLVRGAEARALLAVAAEDLRRLNETDAFAARKARDAANSTVEAERKRAPTTHEQHKTRLARSPVVSSTSSLSFKNAGEREREPPLALRDADA